MFFEFLKKLILSNKVCLLTLEMESFLIGSGSKLPPNEYRLLASELADNVSFLAFFNSALLAAFIFIIPLIPPISPPPTAPNGPNLAPIAAPLAAPLKILPAPPPIISPIIPAPPATASIPPESTKSVNPPPSNIFIPGGVSSLIIGTS